jgi:hypothetical protein
MHPTRLPHASNGIAVALSREMDDTFQTFLGVMEQTTLFLRLSIPFFYL